jgi:hypothetical protein
MYCTDDIEGAGELLRPPRKAMKAEQNVVSF